MRHFISMRQADLVLCPTTCHWVLLPCMPAAFPADSRERLSFIYLFISSNHWQKHVELPPNKGRCQIQCRRKNSWFKRFFLLTCWRCAIHQFILYSSSFSSPSTFVFVPVATLRSSDRVIIDENKQMRKGIKDLTMQNKGGKAEGGKCPLHTKGFIYLFIYFTKSRSLFHNKQIWTSR